MTKANNNKHLSQGDKKTLCEDCAKLIDFNVFWNIDPDEKDESISKAQVLLMCYYSKLAYPDGRSFVENTFNVGDRAAQIKIAQGKEYFEKLAPLIASIEGQIIKKELKKKMIT